MSISDFINNYDPDIEGSEINHSFMDTNINLNIEYIINEYQNIVTKQPYKLKVDSTYKSKKCSEIKKVYGADDKNNSSIQKLNNRSKATTFLNQIIYASFKASGLKENEYFNLLKKVAGGVKPKGDLESSLFEKRMLQSILLLGSSKEFNSNPKRSSDSLKHMSLHWLGETHLDLFVRDLVKTFNGIKPTKNVFKLFESKSRDFKVILPSKYLKSFITLFYKLHKSGIIKVIGNRGLYVYLQNHLEAPENDNYPKRAFRKLRHEAEKNNTVKNNISRFINPLLIKYCPVIN